MAASALRKVVGEGWGLLSLFALFPVTFYGVNFGLGVPVLVAISIPQVHADIVLAASLLSISAGLGVIFGLARLLPLAKSVPATETAHAA